MASKYSVKLKTIVEENKLIPLHTSSDYETRLLTTADINRPALQLAGFYNYFDPSRLQIIGRVESTYLELKSDEERRKCFEALMQWDISALVLCHGAAVFPECVEMAEKYDRNVFTTPEDTSDFMANVISSLHVHLAPRTTMHGVLVEVHGEGLLLTGDSGIGKSETALELIKRGHRLIADDAVDIRKVNKTGLVGTAPELIRYYMELRGIGVVDVRHIYGVGAVKPEGAIDLVVNMEVWEDGKMYDRLGLIDESTEILGVTVPSVTIPVRPGRNLAVILELAAMNNRQKKMGYNAAETLASNHDSAIDAGVL
ncbi:MAG: HPr(Ser) kinase/phosphatase [Bacillota bacterium]|nr:HPr(Ser) kinase/phosphatase [Bacillota bacterium]